MARTKDTKMANCKAIVRRVIAELLPEGAPSEVTTDAIIQVAAERHAFDSLEAPLEHLGKVRIVHEEAQRIKDSNGRRALVFTRRRSRVVEVGEDIFGEAVFETVLKRAEALEPGEETRFPLVRSRKQIVTMIRQTPTNILPKPSADLLVGVAEFVFAHPEAIDEDTAAMILDFARMAVEGKMHVAVAAG